MSKKYSSDPDGTIWHVEVKGPPSGRWYHVVGSYGAEPYARGWFDALTHILPRRPTYRLVSSGGNVVEEVKGTEKENE